MTTATPARVRHLPQGHVHRPGGGHGGRWRHLRPMLGLHLSQLEDDDSVSVSVDLLRRMRDGIL